MSIQAEPWPLDYGWGHHRLWTQEADVCLEGRLRGEDLAAAVAKLRAWVAARDQTKALVDKVARPVALLGGASFYLEEDDEGASLFAHSMGEDAFDSLEWVGQELAAVLKGTPGEGRLIWVQHRFDRDHHRLRWA